MLLLLLSITATAPRPATAAPPGGAISGRVTLGADPIAAATISLLTLGYGSFATTTTDPTGRFSFEAVPDGRYHVRADPAGLLGRTGQEVSIDAAHPTATADIAYPIGIAAGTILYDGQPVGGATLSIYSQPVATTDAFGAFVLRGLDEGWAYDVRVTPTSGVGADFPNLVRAGDVGLVVDIAPDVLRGTVRDHTGAFVTGAFAAFNRRGEPAFSVQAIDGVIHAPLPAGEYRLTYLPGDGALGYRFPQTLEVHSSDHPDFDLMIPEPGSVSGLIEIAPGVPVPSGTRVSLVHTDIQYSFSDIEFDNRGTDGLSAATTTDDAGRYRFSMVWPGSYRVWWSDDARRQRFSASGQPRDKQTCSAASDECPFVVEPGRVVSVNGIRPAGAVHGTISYRGAPVSNASVTVIDNIDEERLPPSWHLHGTVLTDGVGNFSVPGLAPGAYRLSVSSEAGGAFSGPFVVSDQMAGPLRVSVGRAVLDGTVRLADGSSARDGIVSVREVGAEERRPALFRESGRFVMENAPEGTLELTIVELSGYHGWWTYPTLIQTTETLHAANLDVVLPEPGSLAGTITLPTVSSASTLTVSIDNHDGSRTQGVAVNADRTYSIASVLPGTYQLRVTSGVYRDVTTEALVTVTVTSGRVTQADVGDQPVLPETR